MVICSWSENANDLRTVQVMSLPFRHFISFQISQKVPDGH